MKTIAVIQFKTEIGQFDANICSSWYKISI